MVTAMVIGCVKLAIHAWSYLGLSDMHLLTDGCGGAVGKLPPSGSEVEVLREVETPETDTQDTECTVVAMTLETGAIGAVLVDSSECRTGHIGPGIETET